MAKRVFSQIEDCKENLFHPMDQIQIKQARFDINDKIVEVDYGKLDQKNVEELKQAIVKSMDKGRISREAYRSLARINQNLPREGAISTMRKRTRCFWDWCCAQPARCQTGAGTWRRCVSHWRSA